MDNRTYDSQCAIELVENSMEKVEAEGSIVKEVIADTGYDTHEIFIYLGMKGIKAVITGNRAKDKANGYGRCRHVDEKFFIYEC